MYKILAFIFGLLASPAFAQNVTCATRPTSDNSNACASTAFTNNKIAAKVPDIAGQPSKWLWSLQNGVWTQTQPQFTDLANLATQLWGSTQTITAGWTFTVPITGNIYWTQTGSGATQRTVASRLMERVYITDFGADRTASVDSCTAITNALAAIPATNVAPYGTEIFFPAGIYITSCFPAVADRSVSIRGSGSGTTQITFTSNVAGKAGLSFTYGVAYAGLHPTIEGLHLSTVAVQTNGNACISATFNSSATSSTSKGTTIRDVVCDGDNSTTYWADGVKCAYCEFLSVASMHIIGKPTTGATVGTNLNRAFYLDNSTDGSISDVHVYYAQKGVSLDHDSEGLKLIGSSFVMADYGIYAESTWSAPGLYAAGNHFNVTKGAIILQGGGAGGQSSQTQITDNLIYRWTGATQNPWAGIACYNGTYGCSDHRWTGNNIIAFQGGGPTGTAYCFDIGSNTSVLQIDHNHCRQSDYFINMGSSTASTIQVSDNTAQTLGTGWQTANLNISAEFRGNTPVVAGPSDSTFVTQGLNATQWNIGGVVSRIMRTNASGATTVTDGFGGLEGLQTTVYCNDTNTTLQHSTAAGTKFALAGAVNYTCPRVGATITFVYTGQWREIGRAN
jgi:hypothetical protein